jgi:3-phosphoshikimate 1-carboxyvinyltransferase
MTHKTLLVRPQRTPLRGTVQVPGDKSISHRTLLFGALAQGESEATGWLPAEDCLATLHILRQLGVTITHPTPTTVRIQGMGLQGLKEAENVLDCGGSGTTMRLLVGLLSGFPFLSVLTGNPALRRRPMGRVATPLRQMGSTILARAADGRERAPLAIRGGSLHGMEYASPVASAQVKSAILLAGLYAEGSTTVIEPGPSRDHTERLLRAMGVSIESDGARVTIQPPTGDLRPLRGESGEAYAIPSDPSSAAFPIAAAVLVRASAITLPHVGINSTRTGLVDILNQMGEAIAIETPTMDEIEPTASLHIRHDALQGVEVGGDTVVRAIDEFPILAVLATQAAGRTRVRDAGELRVKESDRIASVAQELSKMGVVLEEAADGFTVQGQVKLQGAEVDSHMDHRLAMALAVAGLVAQGDTRITRAEVIDDSFPGFVELMRSLGAELEWESPAP